jgi:hypothetical protein
MELARPASTTWLTPGSDGASSGDGQGPSKGGHQPRWQAPGWAHGRLAPTSKATDEEPADQDDDGHDDQELKGYAHAGYVDVHQRCH